MIESKIQAAIFMQKLNDVGDMACGALDILGGVPRKEYASCKKCRAAAKPVGDIQKIIVMDVLYPIVARHPELRPPELLDPPLRAGATYNLVFRQCIDGPEIIIKRDMDESLAADELRSHRNAFIAARREGFFWLELDAATVRKHTERRARRANDAKRGKPGPRGKKSTER
jgi:hypothetical protein